MNEQAPLLPRISDYVAWHARRHPETEALVLDERRQSYGDLDARVDHLARALLAAGVRKGDRVATLQMPHPDYVAAFLATASIGAIWVGLNPRYRLGELRYVVDDAEPCVLLTRTWIEGRDYGEELATLRAQCPGLRRMVAFDGEPGIEGIEPMQRFLAGAATIGDDALHSAREACGGRDPCLIVYTSGSTGAPKGALLCHQALAAFSLAQNRLWPLSPHRAVNYFPINHIGCVVDCTLPCLIQGGTLFFMERFDPAECLRLMERERVTLWASVPSVLQMQLDLPDFDRHDLSAVQLIVWEGAAMPAAAIERLRRVHPRLATNYGMTETTSAITATEPSDDVGLLAESVGRAFPGVDIRLADAQDRPVADGESGEVQVRSQGNLLGYWRQPEATARAFTADGYFRTGDLAVRLPEGRYRVVGRLKEMYKSGGYNVYPREIENVLEAHPAVATAAVVATPDPIWQEVGVAFVKLHADASIEALQAHCRAHLANYKIPKRFVIETELPLLPIGKLDRQRLREMALALG